MGILLSQKVEKLRDNDHNRVEELIDHILDGYHKGWGGGYTITLSHGLQVTTTPDNTNTPPEIKTTETPRL